MKKHDKYFILSFVIILLSSPLGRLTINILYSYTNLATEYNTLLKGFINSYLLTGLLLFLIGMKDIFIDKKN